MLVYSLSVKIFYVHNFESATQQYLHIANVLCCVALLILYSNNSLFVIALHLQIYMYILYIHALKLIHSYLPMNVNFLWLI